VRKGSTSPTRPLTVVGLFAGVGGIELGMERSGHSTKLLCEIDPAANEVLAAHFPDVRRVRDIRDLERLPRRIDLVTAGFPCQDLSQAGATRGLAGKRSSLVSHVFRLLGESSADWILLENVPFMLQLGRGAAMAYVVEQLERLDYRWAYRIIDSRAFGLPHRRERVFLLASRRHAPEHVLFSDDVACRLPSDEAASAFGFYWTEGLRGLGWAADSVPTLKGGSSVGIPSPPAIWFKRGEIVTPDIRDAERLQGFPVDWTRPAERVVRPGYRWTLVGNAVTVDVARWIGRKLLSPPEPRVRLAVPLEQQGRWPRAAYGHERRRFEVAIGSWPIATTSEPIASFLHFPTKPLSSRAATGFLSRLQKSCLRYPPAFADALAAQIERMMERPTPEPVSKSRSTRQLRSRQVRRASV